MKNIRHYFMRLESKEKNSESYSDPVIMESTIALVLGSSTPLFRSYLEHFILTNKAKGTICFL